MLLSEDALYRKIAVDVAGVAEVWLQPVLLQSARSKIVGFEDYQKALVGLAAHRHAHVSITSRSLNWAYDNDSDGRLELQSACKLFRWAWRRFGITLRCGTRRIGSDLEQGTTRMHRSVLGLQAFSSRRLLAHAPKTTIGSSVTLPPLARNLLVSLPM